MKHTKWYLRGDQIFEDQMDSLICTIDGLDADNRLVVKESEANARLIAAAPETKRQCDKLLAVCELAARVIAEQHQALQTILTGIAKKATIKAASIQLPPMDIIEVAIAEAKPK